MWETLSDPQELAASGKSSLQSKPLLRISYLRSEDSHAPHSYRSTPCDLWVHDLPALCYLNSPWLLLCALVPVPRRQLVIPLFYRPVPRAQPSTWLGPVKPRPGRKGQSQQAWATSFSGVMAFLGPAVSHLLCQQHRTEPSSSTVH